MANIQKPTTLNTIWALGGTKVDPGVTKINIGWVVQLPPYEYQNWVDNRQDTAIAHFNQHGVPEWDVNTEYQGNLSYSQGSNGIVYKCIATNIGLDPVNPNNSLSWKRAFEDYGSVQVVQTALNVHLNNYATLSGISNVVLARANLSVYSKAETDNTFAFKGGSSSTAFLVATATQPSHAVPLSQINSLLVAATETVRGTTTYASTSEVEQGTIDNKSTTPLKLNTVYLKKSGNLTGLSNLVTARSNLGLGDIATRATSEFTLVANNLSEVNPSVARTNLGLTSTATQPETYFLRASLNLADVASTSAARTNLGLTATATTPPTSLMFKSDNLAGLTSVTTARANLGLGSAALLDGSGLMMKANNLSDVSNVQSARNNLSVASYAETQAMSVGVAKSWQNMLPSRQAGVTYTNNTSGPIMLALSAYSFGGPQHYLYINGFEIFWLHSDGTVGQSGTVSMVIPVGTTYSVNRLPNTWLELR